MVVQDAPGVTIFTRQRKLAGSTCSVLLVGMVLMGCSLH